MSHKNPTHRNKGGTGEQLRSTSAMEPQKNACANHEKPTCTYEPPPEQKRISGLTRFEWVIAGLTFCGIVIAFFTALFIHNQLDAARKDERSWINGSTGSFGGNTTQAVAIPVSLKNTGKTPARKVHGKFVAIVVKNGDSPDLTYNDHAVQDETSGIMFPDDPFTFSVPLLRMDGGVLKPWVFTEPEIADLKAGNTFCEVYGEVTYLDIFDIPHWLHYCRFPSAATIPVGLTARKCSDYNDADNK